MMQKLAGWRTSRQANNNLLSFPYGDRFKERKRTGEKAIKSRLSEPSSTAAGKIGLSAKDGLALRALAGKPDLAGARARIRQAHSPLRNTGTRRPSA
jgi:hypothetical protein